jgi:hypothetical protein
VLNRLSPSSPYTRCQTFEQLDEPLRTTKLEIGEPNHTVFGLRPTRQIIESEVDERLVEPTAQRLGSPLLLLEVARTRMVFLGVEARHELVDRM